MADTGTKRRLFLLMIPVLGLAAVVCGWLYWQQQALWQTIEQQSAQITTAHAQIAAIKQLQQAQQQSLQSEDAAIARVQAVQEKNQAAVAQTQAWLGSGEDQLQKRLAMGLLQLAQERAELFADAPTAAAALLAADAHLAMIRDPRVAAVRQVLAKEHLALLAYQQADRRAQARMALYALEQAAADWPVKALPAQGLAGETQAAPVAPSNADDSVFTRLARGAQTALASVFVFKKHDQPWVGLLGPEQATTVTLLAQAKLAAMQHALDGKSSPTITVAAQQLQQWLPRYFDVSDPRVAAALAELSRLATTDMAMVIPVPKETFLRMQAVLP